jgi:hypothetical protein
VKTAVLIGAMLGALIVLDPFATAYLLRDFSPLRDLPFLISIATALAIGSVFAVRAFRPDVVAKIISNYWVYFPLLFLVSYQLTGVAAGPLDPTEIVIAVFAMLLLAGLFIRKDDRFMPSPFNALHLALAICITLSLVSHGFGVKVFAYIKSFKPFVVFFLLYTFLVRGDFIRPFLRWLVILGVISAAFGIVQEIVWLTTQELLSFVPQDRLKRMFEDTPLGPLFRVPALMVSYRSLALYLATALMFMLCAWLWRDQAPIRHPRWLLTGAVIISIALMLTTAKDILLGVGAAIALLAILRRPSRIVPVGMMGLAGALALAAAITVVPGTVDTAVELTRTVPKSEQERIRLDRDSIERVLHSPYTWTGRGIGLGERYTAHVRGWPAHNAFILAASEIGVIGLAVYLSIYVLVFVRVVALNLIITSGPYLPIARGLLATLVVTLMGAQFEASYLDIFVWAIFAIVEALWIQLRRQMLHAPKTATG